MVLGILFGAALLFGRPLQAQTQLTLFAGGYFPTDKHGIELLTRAATRRGSVAFGGRVTFWTSKAVGLEVTGGFSPARISRTTLAGRFPRSTNVAFGSGKVMLNLMPKTTGLTFLIGGGVGGVHAAKSVIDPAQSETKIGGVGGVAFRLPFGENVALRGDLEDYLYNGNYGTGRKFTQDLVLSGGLSITF